MKFTFSWLKDYLDTSASAPEIADKLTAIGLELESLTDHGAALEPFTVALVKDAKPHPDADKLRVCQVDTGTETLEIVCGAPNARAGIKVALAKIGSVIPTNGLVIKKSKIRGVESNGMLCSARELGLGDDHAGIIELPETARLGDSIVDVLGLGDPLFDIAVTPNRGDCLGVYGIARDLAAAGMGTLKPLATAPVASAGDAPISVRIESETDCPLFIGRVIEGVKNGPSPEWLQARLKAVGLRPISALVDITNFMTIAFGRPLHVYDTSKLSGGIIVRRGRSGEAFDALNDKHYEVNERMIVIADEAKMLGLGGIVGGKESGCTETTTSVLLECALFNPIIIAEAGRLLSAESDARYRFERQVDPAFAKDAVEIATQMIIELCGGKALKPAQAGEAPKITRAIAFNPHAVLQYGGLELAETRTTEILRALGCTVAAAKGSLTVTPPSWRHDLTQPRDLVEEVLRIHGFEHIPSVSYPKPARTPAPALSPQQRRVSALRRTLAARHLHETYSWGFTSQADAQLFGWSNRDLVLQNPISAELSVMRPSLLGHLVRAATRNSDRGLPEVRLFEIGAQFSTDLPGWQQMMASGVRAGKTSARDWQNRSVDWSAFDAKADSMAALSALGLDVEKCQISTTAPSWYHPGRCGSFQLGPKQVLAHFGELHPALLSQMGVEQRVMAFEVYLDRVPVSAEKSRKRKPLVASDFQVVERDFAFVLDQQVSAGELLKAVRLSDKALIREIRVFDHYTGERVAAGKKSVAISVLMQAPDRTLTEAEIDNVSKAIVSSAQALGASLRS